MRLLLYGNSIFNFGKNCKNIFQVAIPFFIPITNRSNYSVPPLVLVIVNILKVSHSNRYLILVLTCSFIISNCFEHLFICLCASMFCAWILMYGDDKVMTWNGQWHWKKSLIILPTVPLTMRGTVYHRGPWEECHIW